MATNGLASADASRRHRAGGPSDLSHVPCLSQRRSSHDAVSDLMIRHGIERIVFVPADSVRQWIPDARDSFHAWPAGVTMANNGMGRGDTAAEAIMDAVRQMEASQ